MSSLRHPTAKIFPNNMVGNKREIKVILKSNLDQLQVTRFVHTIHSRGGMLVSSFPSTCKLNRDEHNWFTMGPPSIIFLVNEQALHAVMDHPWVLGFETRHFD